MKIALLLITISFNVFCVEFEPIFKDPYDQLQTIRNGNMTNFYNYDGVHVATSMLVGDKLYIYDAQSNLKSIYRIKD